MFSVPGEVQPVSRTASVETLIAQFDNNPFVISRALRQLRDTDAGRFEEAALRAIAGSPESSGIRFVARLVPLNDAVLELIANPQAFEMDGCRRIVEVMRRIDAQTESKLIRQISERHLPPPLTERILDVIDAITESARLVPALMQVYRTANPYLRARLVLSIGKYHRNKDWIEDRMRDADPRVRANMIEANWRQKDELALTIFTIALRDTHHRVVGNGAVGFHNAGDLRSLRVFSELLASPEPHSRAAGLWAVGHLQDTRFLGSIAPLAADRDATVRRAFVVAQAGLKRALEVHAELPKLKLRLIKSTRQPLAEAPRIFHNHVFLEVKDPLDASGLQGLKTLQFHIFENGHAILDYSVQERTSYTKPGSYDIYFDAATEPKCVDGNPEGPAAPTARRLEIAVLTEFAKGEFDFYDFGDVATAPEPSDVARN